MLVLGATLSGARAEEPSEQVRRANFIQIRPTRLYRLIYRRPRDPSRFYHLLGDASPERPAATSSMPRVKLPARGASLRWTPGSGNRRTLRHGT